MLNFTGRVILLDIEGTTSSVSFVYDEMFPFVRRELVGFLAKNSQRPDVVSTAILIGKDAGKSSLSELVGSDDLVSPESQQKLAAEVLRQMDADLKATGLKQLQGLIWEAGFQSGQLRAHVYDDVAPTLKKWKAAGFDLRIYSSGSIQAQKLFFGHTIAGDLLPLFSGHYDTTIGGKRDAVSYQRIAQDIGCEPAKILFLSDITAELDAALQAGLQTGLILRPGNAPQTNGEQHPAVESFEKIQARRE
jgi:enolase-phosphatase E1